jgi:hypothetical protein
MHSVQDSNSKLLIDKLFINGVAISNPTIIREMIDEFKRSNTTLSGILLPVFGPWVDVVVAFYFGSEQARTPLSTY